MDNFFKRWMINLIKLILFLIFLITIFIGIPFLILFFFSETMAGISVIFLGFLGLSFIFTIFH
jgi:hypothetical protein